MTLEEIHQELWAAMRSIAGSSLSVYDNDVPATPEGNYAVLWTPASRAVSTRVGWKATDLDVPFQITVVSRNSPRALAASIDLVRGKFTGLRLGDPTDPNAPRCKENGTPSPPPGNDKIPGDKRWWMPMPYRLTTSI